MTADCKFSEE